MVFQRTPPPKKRAVSKLGGMVGPPQDPLPQVKTEPLPPLFPLAPLKKRGRPPKHATEEERKIADAARKRGERAEASEEKQIEKIEAGLPSEYHTGSEDASKRAGQGGSSNEDLERLAQGTSAALSTPDALVADDVNGTVDNLLGPTSSITATKHVVTSDVVFPRRCQTIFRPISRTPFGLAS
jgi:hypothetical protein